MEAVARQIRAFDPAPGAWGTIGGVEVKLFGPRPLEEQAPAGAVVRTDPELVIGTGDGSVAIAEVQPSGKRRMPAREWTRGRGTTPGQVFA
jgi:methionyl-tRNA formyltransferase